MAACKNCFLFDEEKLHGEIGFFEKRRDMTIFMLNVILNIQHFLMDHFKCDGLKICLFCKIADIYKEKTVYEIYKNCLDLDFFKQGERKSPPEFERLLEKHDHFLCKVINEKYLYYHECFSTGKKCFYDVGYCLKNWEKFQIEKIKKKDPRVVCHNFLKECNFNLGFFKQNGKVFPCAY